MSKALVPVKGQPLLYWLIYWLKRYVEDIRVFSGRRTDVESLTKSIEVVTSISGEAIGTAWSAFRSLDNVEYDAAIIVNADTINQIDMGVTIDSFKQRGKDAMLAVTRFGGAQNPSVCAVDTECNLVFSKEGSQHAKVYQTKKVSWRGASTGILIVTREALGRSKHGGHSSIEQQLIPMLIDDQAIAVFDNGVNLCIDIGTMKGYNLSKMRISDVERILIRQSGIDQKRPL